MLLVNSLYLVVIVSGRRLHFSPHFLSVGQMGCVHETCRASRTTTCHFAPLLNPFLLRKTSDSITWVTDHAAVLKSLPLVRALAASVAPSQSSGQPLPQVLGWLIHKYIHLDCRKRALMFLDVPGHE
ncbi:hypothetical protein EDD37DRAFT_354562 [Exophiala viscosa]|uniref:uncharacterized protein n=1 Tax=Exophiala viscosa TaxID=2486360 RepID=UPI00219F3FDA|nr:hypothetical protein EDD37DRAFT_354562 [Exophiala viscosa]